MASGHLNRVKRPDTWLHRPGLQNMKKVLANREPSTHGPIPEVAPFDEQSLSCRKYCTKPLEAAMRWTANN